MSTEELLSILARTLTEHVRLPAGYEWTPVAGLAALSLLGLLMLIRGARWAPAMAGVTFMAAGGLGGSWLAGPLGLPIWPVAAACGAAALLVGVLGFRLWQALLLAACCAGIGVSVYYARVLTPHVQSWLAGNLDEDQWIQLQPAGTVVAERTSAATELSNLWMHLAEVVPAFQISFWGVAVITALAGLLFGLLLPRASRALWAATIGTVFAGAGATGFLQRYSPETLTWLTQNTAWAWGILLTVWLVSVVYNLFDGRSRRTVVAPQPTAVAPAT